MARLAPRDASTARAVADLYARRGELAVGTSLLLEGGDGRAAAELLAAAPREALESVGLLELQTVVDRLDPEVVEATPFLLLHLARQCESALRFGDRRDYLGRALCRREDGERPDEETLRDASRALDDASKPYRKLGHHLAAAGLVPYQAIWLDFAAGRHERALQRLEEALVVAGSQPWRRGHLQCFRAKVLADLGRHDECEPHVADIERIATGLDNESSTRTPAGSCSGRPPTGGTRSARWSSSGAPSSAATRGGSPPPRPTSQAQPTPSTSWGRRRSPATTCTAASRSRRTRCPSSRAWPRSSRRGTATRSSPSRCSWRSLPPRSSPASGGGSSCSAPSRPSDVAAGYRRSWRSRRYGRRPTGTPGRNRLRTVLSRVRSVAGEVLVRDGEVIAVRDRARRGPRTGP